MKTLNRDKIKSMDDLRYSFDWIEFTKQNCKSKEVLQILDDCTTAFMSDDRVDGSLRSCHILFSKQSEKHNQDKLMIFFNSAYGRDYISDFAKKLENLPPSKVRADGVIIFGNDRLPEWYK